MITLLIAVLAIAAITSVIGLCAGVWMTSQDLEITRTKEPVPHARSIEGFSSGAAPAVAPQTRAPRGQIRRSLTNDEGRTIDVVLISKTDTDVTFMLDGQSRSYAINKLSPEDQEYIRKWQP